MLWGTVLLKPFEGSKNSSHERAGDVAQRPFLETQRGKVRGPTAPDSAPDPPSLAPAATAT